MKRVQIVCIGASTLYGVGGTEGGWPDILKRELHGEMYGSGQPGQGYEIYNLGVSGATLDDMLERTELFLRTVRKPDRKLVSVLHAGSNDAMAVETPDNFISTPEQYRAESREFLGMIQQLSDNVLCLGATPMDQEKVMPIIKDSERGTKVYFPNDRIRQFEVIRAEVAEELGIKFIPLYDKAADLDWLKSYKYQDGIHPNDAGHQWLYENIRPEIMELVTS